jgi:hypothetical protein
MLRPDVATLWLKAADEAPGPNGLTESHTGLDVVGLASTAQAE